MPQITLTVSEKVLAWLEASAKERSERLPEAERAMFPWTLEEVAQAILSVEVDERTTREEGR